MSFARKIDVLAVAKLIRLLISLLFNYVTLANQKTSHNVSE